MTSERGRPKLFISYGRKDASDLASRLNQELSARGFDVWLDKSKLRGGKAWEQQIVDALRVTDVMIAILSPHSTRRNDEHEGDSVCLDELAFARFEHPPTPIVPVLGVHGATLPLTVLRLHYIDFVDALLSEKLFETKLAELLAAIDDAVSGRPKYRDWDSWLSPAVDFGLFLYLKHRGFVGRDWLFEQIERWRTAAAEPALLIVGEPGLGKSAIIAELTLGRASAQTVATHCCQWDVPETLRPATFVRSIAYQCASRIPEYANLMVRPELRGLLERVEIDPASTLELAVLGPLGQLEYPPDSPLCLCVDALDEATTSREGPTILDLLDSRIERLPSWLKLIATTRHESAVLRRLGQVRTIVLDPASGDNMTDLRHYVTSHTQNIRAGNDEQLLAAREALIQHSGGNFLYAEHVLRAVWHARMNLLEAGDLPPGLDGTYERFLCRSFSTGDEFQKVRPILEILCAAEGPIPRSLLASATDFRERELVRRIAPLNPFLRQTRSPNQPEPDISLWHKSFYDFLTDVDHADSNFAIEPLNGHTAVASRFADVVLRFDIDRDSGSTLTDDPTASYLRRRGLDHLALSGIFFHGFSAEVATRLVYYSTRNSGGYFASTFISEALKLERLDDIQRLVEALNEVTRIHYIKSGLLQSGMFAFGAERQLTLGRIEDAKALSRALTSTGYAVSVMDQLLASRGMDPFYSELVETLNAMRHMAGGLDVAGWAHHLSGYFAH